MTLGLRDSQPAAARRRPGAMARTRRCCVRPLVWHAILVIAILVASSGAASAWLPIQSKQGSMSKQEQLQVNNLLDNVLITVQKEIARSGLGSVMLPNFETTQSKVTLKATEGLMHDLSSIYRDSASFIKYGTGNITLSTSFSVQDLQASYHLHAKWGFIQKSADIGATISRNSVNLEAGLYYYGDVCYVAVDHVAVDVLDGINWKVSGFGPINGVVEAAVKKFVSADKIKQNLNTSIKNAVSKYKAQCLSFIPGVNQDYKPSC